MQGLILEYILFPRETIFLMSCWTGMDKSLLQVVKGISLSFKPNLQSGLIFEKEKRKKEILSHLLVMLDLRLG